MLAALERHFGHAVRATNPEGGFFLWVTFTDESIDTEKLFEIALAEGGASIPGRAFSAAGNLGNALRLRFAASTPERIDEGVARLARSVKTLAVN